MEWIGGRNDTDMELDAVQPELKNEKVGVLFCTEHSEK